MSLTQIASSMKAQARREGHAAMPSLAHGAQLYLAYTRDGVTENFTLTITRAGRPRETPHTIADAPARMYFYAAKIEWRETLSTPSATDNTARRVDNSLPKTEEEIAAWAKTLGPGVKIRNVNVFTGEI